MAETGRSIRGGSWNNDVDNAESDNRNNANAGNRNDNMGFALLSTNFPQDRCRLRIASQCIRICPGHYPVLAKKVRRIDQIGAVASGRPQKGRRPLRLCLLPSFRRLVSSRLAKFGF